MFLIRADGNAQIGAGHLMRCMAIAEELALSEGRQNICFICADKQSAELAESYGFQSHALGTDYRDMESELPLWQELAAKWATRVILLVDSYYVTDKYLAALRQFGYTVLMDDYGTHCYPVDCVINYNAPADLSAYKKLYQGQDVRLHVGSSYVPLRRQFQAAAGNPGVREEPREVLITTGGGDAENIAGKILEEIYVGNLIFHLVMGQFNPHFQEMAQLAETHGNIRIHHNVSDMAGLMRGCDIALTAGGFTIYELAAMGVPFICFSYAENQELLTEYIGKEGIAGVAGAWHKEPAATLGKMIKMFRELTGSRELRNSYSIKERAMIDGRGAERLAGALAGGVFHEKKP